MKTSLIQLFPNLAYILKIVEVKGFSKKTKNSQSLPLPVQFLFSFSRFKDGYSPRLYHFFA